jgi:hypothetical protein
MNIDVELRPSGILPTLSVLPWMSVAGYDRLDDRLRAAFSLRDDDVDVSLEHVEPTLSARLVFFPYDFRRSTEETAARLAWDIARRLDAIGGGTRVTMIGHSMGGLIARRWWATFGGSTVCRRLITVGTPHRGAPKALDWLVNGVALRSGALAGATRYLLREPTEVLRRWPSIFDLLPRYPAVQDLGGHAYPHELSVATDEFRSRAREAFDGHQRLQDAVDAALATSPASATIAYYSTGHATPSRAAVRDGRLEVTRDDPEWLPGFGWMGDGTVPAFSAIPIEQSTGDDIDLLARFAPESHIEMSSSRNLVEHLRSMARGDLSAVRGDSSGSAWFGFDHDDVTAVGEPTQIVVRLRGTDAGGNVPRLSVWRPGAVSFGGPVSMEPGMDAWHTTVTTEEEGPHRIKVEIDHVPSFDRVVSYGSFGAVTV